MDKDKRVKEKCGFKCSTCQYYSKKEDFCKEKEIENCSKKMHAEFSQCDSYLIDKKLVMF